VKESVVTEPTAEHASALRRRLLHGGPWVVATRVAGIGLMFFGNFLLARLLSPQDFGLFILIISVLSFGSIVARFGLDRVIVRFVAESLAQGDEFRAAETLKSALHLGLISTLVASAAWVLCVGVWGEAFFGSHYNSTFVFVTTCGLAVATCMQIVAESFRGFHELRLSSIFYAQQSGPLQNLVFVALLLLVWKTPLSLGGALGFYMLSLAAILPIAMYCLWRTVARRLANIQGARTTAFGRDAVPGRQLFAVCLPIMMAQVLTFSSTQADIWIAGVFCSQNQLALFAAAWRMMLVVSLPLDMINLTVISTIPELHTQGRLGELQRVLQATAGLAAIPSLLVFMALLILPGTVLDVAFGPFYRNAATALVILGAGQLVFAMTGSCGNALTMTGHHNWNLTVNLVATLVIMAIGPLAAARFGIHGLALVSATTLAAKNVVLLLLTRKLVGIWTHARPWQASTWLWRKAAGWSSRQLGAA